MRFSHLLFKSYWFTQPDPALGLARWAWLVFFLALFGGGVAALMFRQKQEEGYRRSFLARLANAGITLGIFGLLWFFFRQQNVFFLGWRFWLLIWFAVFLFWTAIIAYHLLKRLPAIRAEQAARAARAKYLPGKTRG